MRKNRQLFVSKSMLGVSEVWHHRNVGVTLVLDWGLSCSRWSLTTLSSVLSGGALCGLTNTGAMCPQACPRELRRTHRGRSPCM